MTRPFRRPMLAIALIAFGLQVATVANLRCEMPQPAGPATAEHAGHAGHHAPVPTPGAHQSNCICVAGCHVGFGGTGSAVVAFAEPVQVADRVASSEPAPPLPLAARPFALPLAHAPPVSA